MPSTTSPSMPSPYSEPIRDSLSPLPPNKPTKTSNSSKMLKIQSLLNPSTHDNLVHTNLHSASPPPTPAYTVESASQSPSPHATSKPTPSPSKRQKLVKDAAVFVRGAVKGAVNYPPFECTEDAICLTKDQHAEMAAQHQHFEVFPSGQGSQGHIGDYVRHIPYSSEKKSFFGKTGREAFDVFQYTFRVPDDPEKRVHTVMWDYQVGLVRITPFFKACKYSKTTPAKALTTNTGLKELSHSITGGALAAQGYWMPYACARAICLTFAYPIRWALTPIFGPSFIKECLKPEHPGFARFKVEREVVRCAQLEVEGWKGASRDGTPADGQEGDNTTEIPRSAPDSNTVAGKQLRPRKEMPRFKAGSPFSGISSADEDAAADPYYSQTPITSAVDSPAVSPKSNPIGSPAWASVNTPRRILPASSPRAPANIPNQSLSHHLPIATEQSPYSATTSWRDALPANDRHFVPAQPKTPMNGGRTLNPGPKRRISTFEHDDEVAYVDTATESNYSSDSDTTPVVGNKAKRQRREHVPVERAAVTPTPMQPPGRGTPFAGQSTKYTATEARAAHWLLKLSLRDSQLAHSGTVSPGIGAGKGQKRRASVL
ncbi:hypothetical protein MBLNU230_g7768t1 [Neophaeotheca triangularis]